MLFFEPKSGTWKKIVFQHYYKNSILLCSDLYHSRGEERLGTLPVLFSHFSVLAAQIHLTPFRSVHLQEVRP